MGWVVTEVETARVEDRSKESYLSVIDACLKEGNLYKAKEYIKDVKRIYGDIKEELYGIIYDDIHYHIWENNDFEKCDQCLSFAKEYLPEKMYDLYQNAIDTSNCGKHNPDKTSEYISLAEIALNQSDHTDKFFCKMLLMGSRFECFMEKLNYKLIHLNQ